MFTIATAYCGTGDNAAIRRLLHVAVSLAVASHLINLMLCSISNRLVMLTVMSGEWQ